MCAVEEGVEMEKVHQNQNPSDLFHAAEVVEVVEVAESQLTILRIQEGHLQSLNLADSLEDYF